MTTPLMGVVTALTATLVGSGGPTQTAVARESCNCQRSPAEALADAGDRPGCADGDLIVHHDGSFEWAYCWDYAGSQQPYYGAFGEGYDLGPGVIACGVLWAMDLGYYCDTMTKDMCVWDGGVSREPGAVVALVPIDGLLHGYYTCCRTDVEIGVQVSDEFTVGCWADWFGTRCCWFVCADHNGPGGHSWTCVAPGLEWPSGWQPATVVWPEVRSFGIGVHFVREPASVEEMPGAERPPAESPTWGEVKSLFR